MELISMRIYVAVWWDNQRNWDLTLTCLRLLWSWLVEMSVDTAGGADLCSLLFHSSLSAQRLTLTWIPPPGGSTASLCVPRKAPQPSLQSAPSLSSARRRSRCHGSPPEWFLSVNGKQIKDRATQAERRYHKRPEHLCVPAWHQA